MSRIESYVVEERDEASYEGWTGYWLTVPPPGIVWVFNNGFVAFADPGDDTCRVTLPINGMTDHEIHWTFEVDDQNRPTLHPSVQCHKDRWGHGTESHFFIRKGKVDWC